MTGGKSGTAPPVSDLGLNEVAALLGRLQAFRDGPGGADAAGGLVEF